MTRKDREAQTVTDKYSQTNIETQQLINLYYLIRKDLLNQKIINTITAMYVFKKHVE